MTINQATRYKIMKNDTLICIQEPHQGRAIVFSHLGVEDLFAAVTRHYSAYSGGVFDKLIDAADLICTNPDHVIDVCRDALAHDMQSARVLTVQEANEVVRAEGRHALAISAELDQSI